MESQYSSSPCTIKVMSSGENLPTPSFCAFFTTNPINSSSSISSAAAVCSSHAVLDHNSMRLPRPTMVTSVSKRTNFRKLGGNKIRRKKREPLLNSALKVELAHPRLCLRAPTLNRALLDTLPADSPACSWCEVASWPAHLLYLSRNWIRLVTQDCLDNSRAPIGR